MKPKYFVSMLLLVILVASSMLVRVAVASDPVISVSPASKTVNVGEEFTIDINLDYAQNLYGYEVWLSFDRTKLNATSIDYRSYLNEPTNIWHQEVNNIGGYVALAVSSLRPASPKTGGSPPPLATVGFKAIDTGSSTLHLYNTILSDNQSLQIPCTTIDGTVYVVGAVHDVAVIDVKLWKTVVGEGYTVKINVTVTNEGNFTETFNITAYADLAVSPIGDEITIGKQTVNNLLSGETQIVALIWTTIGTAKGNYTISAVADTAPGETDTEDNTYIDGTVLVTVVGDVNGDHVVDIDDLILIIYYWGTYEGGPNWNPNMELSNDIVIDIDDLLILIYYWGSHW